MDPETIGVRSAQDSFSVLIERVRSGEEFVITRWGKPAAVLIDPGKLAGMREEIARLSGAGESEIVPFPLSGPDQGV